jgi:aminocarboxymuconate-semialdehyde decarboxylase
MILAGVLDRHPGLRLLLAHSGGALPQLSSRLASCVAHDPAVASRLRHDPRAYLGMCASHVFLANVVLTPAAVWFDSVNYGSAELSFVADVIARGRRYLGEGDASGSDRLLWGTDHPFFPPLKESSQWASVIENLDAIDELQTWSEDQRAAVRGQNALRLFNLP